MDIDNPPEAYFVAMRRLRPDPPDEETVERIVEIFREYWKKQDSEAAGELVGGVPGGGIPPLWDPRWLGDQVQDISRPPSRCASNLTATNQVFSASDRLRDQKPDQPIRLSC